MLLGARYYDPYIGRFITPDPSRDGLNWYEYAADNPVNKVDPTGNESQFSWSAFVDVNVQMLNSFTLDPGCSPLEMGATLLGGFALGAEARAGWAAVEPVLPALGARVGSVAKWTGRMITGESAQARGFKDMRAFKKAYGSAGEGRIWHHIVEQCRASRFGAEAIHKRRNVRSVPGWLNQGVADLYSRKIPAITRSETLTVRQWLSTQSFEAQYQFGLKALNNVEKGIWR
jgi:hypothetical protein